ncbi:MAG: glycosyltransferase family 2 protein [Chloroflexi bacterium]|nr:glycosyltransferase family 2 protein [Chloroflexota bacterium]
MPPKVTVSITTYNRSHLLRESIRSVLDQTYTDFDLLVCDNASTDATAQVVASFGDSRIRYHRHPANLGMQANYKYALIAPKTELVACLADDDLYRPELLETAVETLDRFPDAAYFACPAQFFGAVNTGELRPRAVADTQTPLLYFPPSQAVNFLGIDNPGPMIVCRRKALHGGLFWGTPNYVPADLLLLTQLMTQGGFVFSNRALLQFRVHEQNASYVLTDARKRLRLICMIWYGVRWLAQFLLDQRICTLDDIETHGLRGLSIEHHVVPLVLALGSWDSPTPLRNVAQRVFHVRTDADAITGRFRLARRLGFWAIPLTEKLSLLYSGWRP